MAGGSVVEAGTTNSGPYYAVHGSNQIAPITTQVQEKSPDFDITSGFLESRAQATNNPSYNKVFQHFPEEQTDPDAPGARNPLDVCRQAGLCPGSN
jgi:hypothetical protein